MHGRPRYLLLLAVASVGGMCCLWRMEATVRAVSVERPMPPLQAVALFFWHLGGVDESFITGLDSVLVGLSRLFSEATFHIFTVWHSILDPCVWGLDLPVLGNRMQPVSKPLCQSPCLSAFGSFPPCLSGFLLFCDEPSGQVGFFFLESGLF